MHLPPRRKHPSPSKSILLAWLLVSTGLFAQPVDDGLGQAATGKPVYEEWVVILLDGKQCGFGSTITTQTDTPSGAQFHTEHQEQFVVKRMSIVLKITQIAKVTEDARGVVLSFEQTTSGVGSEIKSTGVREGDDMVVSSRGQTQRYHLPPLDALGPEKVRQLTLAVPLKPGQTFSFNTFASEYPQAIVVQSGTVVNQEMRDIRGVKRQLWKITSETSMMPGLLTTAWVDDKGDEVEGLAVIPGIGDLHDYATDRAECMKQPEAAEIFAGSLIRPGHAIPSPGDQAQAVYRLTLPDLTKKLTLWDKGEQRILSSEPGTYEIQVTALPVAPATITWRLPHADTPELHSYLQASSYLEINSPEIQALAKQAVGGETNPVKAAHLIESFVKKYIVKKDLNIGFASALETARSREGDCTEHAVLCAALGRAAGLPTRCVLGFGYIPPGEDAPALADTSDSDTGIFGFHMWAEAWVGPDQWVPMDAALGGFDVGHITITKTSLSEINPLVDLNAPVLQLMENLKIDVVKTVTKSKFIPPPAATPAVVPVPAPATTSPSTPPTPVPAPDPPPQPPAQHPSDVD